MRAHIGLLISAVVFGLLSACGGGGSSSGSSSSNSSAQGYPLDAAITAFMQTGTSQTLMNCNGMVPGANCNNSYELQLAWTPGGQQMFHGTSAFTSVRTLTVLKGGKPFSSSSETEYFLLGPYKRLGSVDSSGNQTLASAQAALPDDAKIGQSGNLDQESTYVGSGSVRLTQTTNTWNLQGGALATQPFFVLQSDINGEAAQPMNQTFCYLIDSKGNVLGLEVSVPIDGQQIQFGSACTPD